MSVQNTKMLLFSSLVHLLPSFNGKVLANSVDLGFSLGAGNEVVDFQSMKAQDSFEDDRLLLSHLHSLNPRINSLDSQRIVWSTKPQHISKEPETVRQISHEESAALPTMSGRSVLLAQNDSLDIWQSELLSDFKNEIQEVDTSPAVSAKPAVTEEISDENSDSFRIPLISPAKESLLSPVTSNAVVSSSKRDLVSLEKSEEVRHSPFRIQNHSLEYVSLEIELVDDRTVDVAVRKYPLRGMKLQLIGTSFMSISDENGVVRIDNLPAKSSFEFLVVDPFGRVERSHFTVSTDFYGSDKIVKKSVLLRRSAHVAQLAELAGEVFDDQRSSFCGTAFDSNKTDRGRLKGIQAFVAEQENAFALYDGQNGLPSPEAQFTSETGRFCFFGIKESLSTLNFFDGDRFLGTFVVATPSGTHKEISVVLEERRPLEVVANVVGSAAEQRTRSEEIRNRRDPLDFVEVFPFGASSPLSKGQSEGFLEDDRGVLTFEDSLFLASQSASHERSIYVAKANGYAKSNEVSASLNFVTLYPQGFVEDMAHEANVVYRADLGSIVIEHRKYDNEPFEGQLNAELYDENFNLLAKKPWVWDERPAQKSIFFNLRPGRYHVILKTSAGHWITAQSTVVYSEHLSVIESGADLLFSF